MRWRTFYYRVCMPLQRIGLLSIVILLLQFNESFAQVTFVIEQFPNATPPEDTIFISGTFNNWTTNDTRFMAKKRLDGKLAVTLPPMKGNIQYKFHRGSWAKVETNEKNEYIPNRQFTFGSGTEVFVTIRNWQDVGGAKPFDILIFYFFAIASLGLLTGYFIFRIRNKKRQLSKALLMFLIFVSVILFSRVVFEITSLKWQYYYALLAEILLLISGPLFYFMFRPETLNKKSTVGLHFLPVFLFSVLIILKIVNIDSLQFLTVAAINKITTWNTVIFFGSGLLSSLIYFIASWKTFRLRDTNFTHHALELHFFKQLLWLGGTFLFALISKGILLIASQEKTLSWYDRDFTFISASVFIVMIAWHVFKHEEIFRAAVSSTKTEDLTPLKIGVDNVMKQTKCFKNPHLTLNEFAEIVNIKPHLLSKVINDCYHQNFRDFVNKYRVEEFIAMARQENNKRFTFLALANEVGFNSKSTFNAAFKKVTHNAPRDFFKSSKVLEDS
jgi:AraC-like DNA-binding protein